MGSINPNNPVNERKLSIEPSTETDRLPPKWAESRLAHIVESSRMSRELLKDKVDGIPNKISKKTLINKLFHLNCPKDC